MDGTNNKREITMRTLLIGLMGSLALAGCASSGVSTVSPEALQAPVCASTAECNDAWRRAQVYVASHSGYKIQTATDSIIQTFGPADSSPDIAFQVTRQPMGGGREQIVASAICDNIFGCIPKTGEAIAGFNAYVKGATAPAN
jgi:hypothetical protein